MRICKATRVDLETVIPWIKDEKACRLWAGPEVRFPLLTDRLKADIGFDHYATYVFRDDQDEMVGFGQILLRNNRLHLARILVSPSQRGKGYGKNLCEHLMEEGQKKYGKKDFSLNVYKFNTIAHNLYINLGFIIFADQSMAVDSDSMYMIKRT